MRKILLVSTIVTAMLLSACGADTKVINGVEYDTYGIASESDVKNPNIDYRISGWSVAWAIILCETIVAPIYFIGWDLYEPVGVKDPAAIKGQVHK